MLSLISTDKHNKQLRSASADVSLVSQESSHRVTPGNVPRLTTKMRNGSRDNRGRRGDSLTDLQADCQVDPAAEGGADGSRVESQVLEEFGEGLRQGRPRTLLRHNHAGPHPRQVQPSRLKRTRSHDLCLLTRVS